ncbi:hypothetical protein ACH1RU_17885 [Vreelandella sp. V23]|nr:hypothetical protein [Halomonas sp. A40-4]QPL45903.1 hypothetical protein IT895_17375 [Halomonas sp. A40-4]
MATGARGTGRFFGAPGMAHSAVTALFPRVVLRDDLGVKVPCTPGKGKC